VFSKYFFMCNFGLCLGLVLVLPSTIATFECGCCWSNLSTEGRNYVAATGQFVGQRDTGAEGRDWCPSAWNGQMTFEKLKTAAGTAAGRDRSRQLRAVDMPAAHSPGSFGFRNRTRTRLRMRNPSQDRSIASRASHNGGELIKLTANSLYITFPSWSNQS